MSTEPRKRKRFLAPQEKYEIWMQLVKGETTIADAAERSGVDRSTVAKLRDVARQGALDALARSRPGKRAGQRDVELADARAETERLRTAGNVHLIWPHRARLIWPHLWAVW